jgi:molecular chaperone GrpE
MQKSKSKNQNLEDKKDPCQDLQDKLARTLADYDNLVKRQAREREEIYLRATRNLIEDLLPVVDDIERAQSHLQDQGLKMGVDNIVRVLDTHGVIEIITKPGDNFDSLIHEAIDSIEGETSGTIVQVFSKGYKWKDGKVIRPTKVQVVK